jgi:kinase suppressor of Ras 2
MAVKELELDPSISYTSEKYRLFKKEIFNLIKTRHGNLILFVGACMEPPRLAIVMRF